MTQISTGDMLRAAIKQGAPLGLEARALMDAGKLVPDSLIVSMIEERISLPDCGRGFILDGFPRTVPQAQALEAMLAKRRKTLDAVIEIKVDETALVERVSGRFTCARCGAGYHDTFKPTRSAGRCDVCGSEEFSRRADDNAETMATRLAAYREQTAPILPYYAQRGLLKSVDGMAEMEHVCSEIETILSSGPNA